MKKYVMTCFVLLLAACMQAPTPLKPEPLSFTNKPPILLNVAHVKFSEAYVPPQQYPHVGHEFPTPPLEALKIWARDRLKPIGGDGYMEVIVNDASVIETRLDKTSGIKGLFTDDQAERYEGAIRVTFRIYDGIHAVSRAETNVFVKRHRSIHEDATAVERDAFNQNFMRDMLQQFDDATLNQMRQYFGPYMR